MSVNGVTFNPIINYPKYTFQSSGDTVDAVDSDSYIEEGAALAKETAYDALNAAFAPVRGVLTLMGMRCGKITDKWIDKDRWPRDGAVEDAYVADGEAGVSDAGDALVEAGLPEAGIDAEVDADAQTCTPDTIVETDFTDGQMTNIDNLSLPGSIMLNRDWTDSWHAKDGLPPWSLVNPSTLGTATLTTIAGEPCVEIDSTPGASGIDDLIYYQINPGFHIVGSDVKGVVQWRSILLTPEPAPFEGCEASVEVKNSSRFYRAGLLAEDLSEPFSSSIYNMPSPDSPVDAFHTFRLEFSGDNERIYVNETILAVSATNTWGTADNWVRVGDNCGPQDGIHCVTSVAYYTEGDHVSFLPPGTHRKVYNLTTANNNLGSGANITYNADEPALTSIIFNTRTGNTPTPDGTWSTWQVLGGGGMIQSPAAQYIQVETALNTTDTLVSPIVYDYAINFCITN